MHSCSERKMMIRSFCLILSISNSILVFASPSPPAKHLCRSDQKDALWEFKTEFDIDSDGMSPSDKKTERWSNYIDFCSWDGISCDPKTGMVVELLLSNSSLNGPLRYNSSLFRLTHLQSLDLRWNDLWGILPDSIRKLRYLKVLNLQDCNFFGNIPSSLGNLSYLTHLYLSYNHFTGELPDSMGNLNQLTELQLESNKLSGKFKPMLLNLTELTWIDLRSNQFEGMLPSNMSSFSKLVYFQIMANSFSGSFPSSLLMIPSLTYLELGRNNFNGRLEIGNISSTSRLRSLSVGDNSFSGPIPRSISKLVSLTYLDLSFWNTERSMVDFNIFLYLKMVMILDLSYLNTRSIVDLSLFSNLTLLAHLDLSGNVVYFTPTLHFPSPLEFLALSSCNIAEFPNFLQTQTSLSELDISANHIEGQVPEWLWRLPQLWSVNISKNFLSGFEGSLDVIQRSGELVILDISSNIFQDPFPLLPNSTLFVFASDNRFSGEIPRSICGLFDLKILVLSNNNITGSIPRCFENFNTTLLVLHLQKNSLSGTFPEEAIGHHLRSLDVGHNQLSGELPKSLMNCTRLDFLNVEDNKFNDTFPFWLSLLHNLEILVLRSNEFHGPIYSSRDSMSFPKLRIFDISENQFNGVLPSNYFQGWTAMASVVDIVDNTLSTYERSYHKQVDLTNKGLKMKLVWSSFTIYKTIDVSGNNLTGHIPESIGLLKELIVFNISNNAFTGHIPQSLSNLTNLQSLDLSQNRLSGKIPPELGTLTFLSRMNFSCNRFEGPIPRGTQIQSQNSSSFAENPGLCGLPLQEICGGREEATDHQGHNAKKVEKDQVLSWIAAAIGYIPGVFCGLIIGHIFTSYKQDWFMRIFHLST